MRYLIGLIADDEERHHRILGEMANRVLGEIESCRVEPSVPYVSVEGSDRDRLFEDTGRFLDLEREDLRGLEAMGRVVRQHRPGGLFPLLVRLMELDTQKHIAILEFIAKDAHRPRRDSPSVLTQDTPRRSACSTPCPPAPRSSSPPAASAPEQGLSAGTGLRQPGRSTTSRPRTCW